MKSSFCVLVLGIAACNAPGGPPKATGGAAAVAVAGGSGVIRVAAFGQKPRPNIPGVSGVQTIDVRLHGVSAPGGSVLVSPSAIAITVDGQQVAAPLVAAQIDLGDTSQAWRVASFSLPLNAASVAITLTLAPQGTVALNGQTTTLDLRGPPISFLADPALLRTQDKVDIQVDLSRSIVAFNGGDVLLPDLMVQY